MTLSNRLTVFFLAALAVVLVAFSATLYALAHTHLSKQLDERVATTMDTLVALAEIEPDGLDWEPELRRFPAHWEGDPPLWAIYDENGSRLDGSHDPINRLSEFAAPGLEPRRERHQVRWNGDEWRVARQTLVFPDSNAIRSRPGRERHQTLVFVTAWPEAPVGEALRALAGSLAGISAVIWLMSGLVGRWICRRALAPVARMTEAARTISPADLGERLPEPPVRDELHDLAVAFNDLLTRLQDSFERQRRFTGDASHQLRTPLTAMLGQMEVALRRDREPDEYRRVLHTSVAQAGRLRHIVEMLLFLARADADAELPDLEEIDLAGWLPKYLAETWAAHPRFGDIHTDVECVGELRVLAQPSLLGQAIGNLIDNALKYSSQGSPVRIRLDADSNDAVITVADTGSGIAAADLERVFDPFFRSEDSRQRGIPGVGLGLAVMARIVAAFGGKVDVETELGEGSRFSIRLTNRCRDDRPPSGRVATRRVSRKVARQND